MSASDPIADLLTRLRNAAQAKHRYIDIPWSNLKQSIIEILKNQGYISQFLIKEVNKKKLMRVFIKYGEKRQPVLNGIKRISKPSLRRYVTSQQIPYVMKGMGIAVLSTSRGIMDGETARKQKTGGELLCLAW